MTYEQGGSGRAGLGIRNGVGDVLSLKDRIAHHYTSGLSTVEVAYNNVERLNLEFKKFHAQQKGKYAHYVLSGESDKITTLKVTRTPSNSCGGVGAEHQYQRD